MAWSPFWNYLNLDRMCREGRGVCSQYRTILALWMIRSCGERSRYGGILDFPRPTKDGALAAMISVIKADL